MVHVDITVDVVIWPALQGTNQLLARDQANHKLYLQRHQSNSAAVNENRDLRNACHTNLPGIAYIMTADIGKPSTTYKFLFDSASSAAWLGAKAKYRPTSTSKTKNEVQTVLFGPRSFTVTNYTDQITHGALLLHDLPIGIASDMHDLTDVDGVIGVVPDRDSSDAMAIIEQLMQAGKLALSYSQSPTGSAAPFSHHVGTSGDDDPAKFTGPIQYAPVLNPLDKHYSYYDQFEVEQTVTYGANAIILNSGIGFFDTLKTFILIASDAFQVYQKATGAVLDKKTGLLMITNEQYEKLQSLHFKIGSATHELTPNAQIWPRALNATLGGENGNIYLIIADLGRTSDAGVGVILGYSFMQRFYTVFDAPNHKVGIAATQSTYAILN